MTGPDWRTLIDLLLALCLIFQSFAIIRLASAVHRLGRHVARRQAQAEERRPKYPTFPA